IINISGSASTHTHTPYKAPAGNEPGADGKPGKPGEPGGNGGHFFGFGRSFSGIDRLTIISNGGKGGPGQEGGDGQQGADGAHATPRETFTDTQEGARNQGTGAQIMARGEWNFIQYPAFSHGNGTYDQELRNYGQPGKKGGDGGMGGKGGVGGHP